MPALQPCTGASAWVKWVKTRRMNGPSGPCVRFKVGCPQVKSKAVPDPKPPPAGAMSTAPSSPDLTSMVCRVQASGSAALGSAPAVLLHLLLHQPKAHRAARWWSSAAVRKARGSQWGGHGSDRTTTPMDPPDQRDVKSGPLCSALLLQKLFPSFQRLCTKRSPPVCASMQHFCAVSLHSSVQSCLCRQECH